MTRQKTISTMKGPPILRPPWPVHYVVIDHDDDVDDIDDGGEVDDDDVED